MVTNGVWFMLISARTILLDNVLCMLWCVAQYLSCRFGGVQQGAWE